MLGVIQGFTVIGVIIGVGVIMGFTEWLGKGGRTALTKLAFYVATPALMFTIMYEADLGILVSGQFLVTAVGMVIIALLYTVFGAIGRWGVGPTTIGAMSASFVNSGNLGIPIAIYVLGDATLVAPVMLVQQLILGPVFMTLLDLSSTTNARTSSKWMLLVRPFTNPVVVGSLSGILANALNFPVPSFIIEPLTLIGGMSVPAVLLAFGMTMRDFAIPMRGPEKGQVALATVLKSFVHPVLAWVISVYVFGLEGQTLLAVVVTAALPAAQNTFAYAVHYQTGERLAQESVLLTTLLSIPVVFMITFLLHP